MKVGEIGEESRERVRFLHVRARCSIIQQGNREVKVGERHRREGLDKDVNHDVRVVQIRIELIPYCRQGSVYNLTYTKYAQFQDRKICEAVVFSAANLMIEVILKDPDIGRVVAI